MAKQDAEDLFREERFDAGIEGKTWAKTFTAVLQALFKINKVPSKNLTLFLLKRRHWHGIEFKPEEIKKLEQMKASMQERKNCTSVFHYELCALAAALLGCWGAGLSFSCSITHCSLIPRYPRVGVHQIVCICSGDGAAVSKQSTTCRTVCKR